MYTNKLVFRSLFAAAYRFPHDDGTCTSHLSAYTPYGASNNTSQYSASSAQSANYKIAKSFLAVGAESGVVSLFGADRDPVNGAYDFCAGQEAARISGVRQAPKQIRSIMNLTTQITSTCFHPSGQIAAIASNQVRCC